MLHGEGITIKRAKEAVNEINLLADLVHIKDCYENLICMPDNFDCSRYIIYSGHGILSHINLETDPVNIKTYIESRLHDSDIRTIVRLTGEGISPNFYHLLRECPPTSISVDQTFPG